MAPSSTPLWLDLRTEYIDDNFDNLVEYLRKADKEDSFYKKTLDLLEKRIVELNSELSSCPLYAERDDKDTTLKKARMLAVYLLVGDGNSKSSAESFVTLMKMLSMLWPNHAKALIGKAIERLVNRDVINLGFTWQNYNDIPTELFTFNLINNAKFSNPINNNKYISSHGTIILNNNGVHLSSKSLKDSYKLLTGGARSMDTGLHMAVVTQASEKLKKSQENDIKAVDKFVKDLKLDFQNAKQSVSPGYKRYYTNGDEATIIVTQKQNKVISVRTIDENYDTIEGHIAINRASIDYYKRDDIYNFFQEGDILKATVKSVYKKEFDFEKQFVDFILDDCEINDFNEDNFAQCVIVNNNENKSRSHMVWINDYGHPIKTFYDDRFEVGAQAYLSIKEINDEYRTIYGNIVEGPLETNNEFNPLEVQRACFRSFIDFYKEKVKPSSDNTHDEPLSPAIMNVVVRMLFDYQKTLLKPSERYKNLSLAMLIATVVDDHDSVAYIEFAKNYLQSLLAFVNDEPVDELLIAPGASFAAAESTQLRVSIVELLREYGKGGNSTLLNEAIDSGKPTISQLAQLIQSANRMKGILTPGALSVIKHEILKALSIENEGDTNLEADTGIYIGIESSTMEFKTSVIYEPGKSDLPNETTQNYNIAKTVCAFLNSQTGGTLFIGVNDQGYVVGFDNDMKFLKCGTIDSFIRYVQDMLKMKLGIDAIYYIKIEPAYDNRVVMLHVEPHPYQVVELDEKAYIRVNSETRPMPEEMRLELLNEKRKKDKGKAANVSWLHRACQMKKCVVLHNYHSSNSGDINDRHIEPYKVLPEDNLVLGFDIDKKACRVYNINRIDYVELKENESWGNTSMHLDTEIDAFHLSGNAALKVSLKLDLLARNQLIEEYPRTKDKIVCDARDSNTWYYNDTVRSVLGVARFYMGLAEHITILEAPIELKSKVKELAQEILSKA